MSLPKQKLHELIDLIPEEKTGEIINLLQHYIEADQVKTPKNAASFRGVLKDWDINVEEECKQMREEWDHRGWDAISN